MRKWIFSCVVMLGLTGQANAFQQQQANNDPKPGQEANQSLCNGFLPKNNIRIPVGMNLVGGISQAQFNNVLDRIQELYELEVSQKGGTLSIDRDWKTAELNAYADRTGRGGRTWMIKMFGGLARHAAMTEDGFAVVACHEMGHHLGGAPKVHDENGVAEWAANEGQADYYSTLKCLRRYFDHDDNERILQGRTLDPLAVTNCKTQHGNVKEQAICIRSAMAGLSLAKLFHDLSGDKTPRFGTPDRSKVKTTDDEHPASQCRLDTYYQASLCSVPVYQALSNTDYRAGSCYNSAITPMGLRPRCWFKP